MDLTILIVDDEHLNCLKIKSFLVRQDVSFKLKILEAHSYKEVRLILDAKEDIHIIFLDIELGDQSGINLAREIRNSSRLYNITIIFQTAFPEYAPEAFDLMASDYLIKPFPFERFQKAFHRAIDEFNRKHNTDNLIPSTSENTLLKINVDNIFIKTGNERILIHITQIYYIESEGNYSYIHTHNNSYCLKKSLVSIESEITQNHLFRIHRKYLCNILFINNIYSNGDEMFVNLVNKQKLPISKGYYTVILNHMKQSFVQG